MMHVNSQKQMNNNGIWRRRNDCPNGSVDSTRTGEWVQEMNYQADGSRNPDYTNAASDDEAPIPDPHQLDNDLPGLCSDCNSDPEPPLADRSDSDPNESDSDDDFWDMQNDMETNTRRFNTDLSSNTPIHGARKTGSTYTDSNPVCTRHSDNDLMQDSKTNSIFENKEDEIFF